MNNETGAKKEFPETRWSIVVNAADLGSPQRNQALDSLVDSYLPALRAHLILRRRLNADIVEDFIQDFVLKKILEQNLVSKADSDRGRFRSFLLKALDNFVRDYFRSNKMLDQLSEFGEEATPDERPVSDVFEAAWARQVFCNAVHSFKMGCDASGNESRWLLFQERLLVPVVSGKETGDYVQLAKKCNFESPKHARNAMVGAKRAFDRAMRSTVKDYLLDESLVDSELEDLFQILKKSDVLDEAISQFVPLEQELRMTEQCFQSIRITGILEMNKDTKVWTDQELAKMWSEILNTTFDKIKLTEACRRIDPSSDPKKTRLRDVLFCDSPSIKMLDLLRTYAKAEYSESGGIEEFPCYFVLYMTAIAAAVYKHQKPLSRLPVDQLKKNLEWVLAFKWLDPRTHEYLQIAKRVI